MPGPDGALYFCEVDTGRIRRLDLSNLRLSTIAGTGEPGFRPESRLPLETPFSAPHEIRWDLEGNLFVVERDNHTVRRIAGRTGLVTTLAGNGEAGFSGDGRPAVLSQLRQPHSIAFDSRNNLLICDIGNQRLRTVTRCGKTAPDHQGIGPHWDFIGSARCHLSFCFGFLTALPLYVQPTCYA